MEQNRNIFLELQFREPTWRNAQGAERSTSRRCWQSSMKAAVALCWSVPPPKSTVTNTCTSGSRMRTIEAKRQGKWLGRSVHAGVQGTKEQARPSADAKKLSGSRCGCLGDNAAPKNGLNEPRFAGILNTKGILLGECRLR